MHPRQIAAARACDAFLLEAVPSPIHERVISGGKRAGEAWRHCTDHGCKPTCCQAKQKHGLSRIGVECRSEPLHRASKGLRLAGLTFAARWAGPRATIAKPLCARLPRRNGIAYSRISGWISPAPGLCRVQPFCVKLRSTRVPISRLSEPQACGLLFWNLRVADLERIRESSYRDCGQQHHWA